MQVRARFSCKKMYFWNAKICIFEKKAVSLYRFSETSAQFLHILLFYGYFTKISARLVRDKCGISTR